MPRRVSFSPDQVPTREPGSDAEFIRVAGQKQPQLVRTYDSTLREWNYTALGRQFFADKTAQYVVSIPVRIVGNRKDELGEYSRRTQLPVNVLGLEKMEIGVLLSKQEATQKLKEKVLEQIGWRDQDGTDLIVYEFSDEAYYYDPAGTWNISTMTTEVRDGRVATDVVINRPMRSLRSLPPMALRPDLFIPEALDENEDGRCVARQLAVVMRMSQTMIEAALSCYTSGQGVTAQNIISFCADRSLPCYVVYGPRVIYAHMPSSPSTREALPVRTTRATPSSTQPPKR